MVRGGRTLAARGPRRLCFARAHRGSGERVRRPAERVERERLEKVVEEGLRIKAEMAVQGAEARGLRQQEIETKKVDLETLHADKEAKKVIKEEKERFEKEALDVIREEEERQRQVKDEQERKEKEAEALQYFAKLDKNGDGYITKDELIFEVVLDQNNDGQLLKDQSQYLTYMFIVICAKYFL